MIPFEPLWAHYKRVIKKNGVVVLFGSEPFSSFLRLSNLGWYKYDWVWEKDKPSNFGNAQYQPLRYLEDIIIFYNGTSIYSPQMWDAGFVSNKGGSKTKEGDAVFSSALKSINRNSTDRYPKNLIKFNTPKSNSEGTFHPTQKPVALLAYLIRTYTNPGETVLDNVFGSCSTGEACLRESRQFIGIEKNEGYYQIGVDRLARVAAELRGEFVPKPAKKPVEDLPMFAGRGV